LDTPNKILGYSGTAVRNTTIPSISLRSYLFVHCYLFSVYASLSATPIFPWIRNLASDTWMQLCFITLPCRSSPTPSCSSMIWHVSFICAGPLATQHSNAVWCVPSLCLYIYSHDAPSSETNTTIAPLQHLIADDLVHLDVQYIRHLFRRRCFEYQQVPCI
jgi:hypothetical protein